ncbi:MAG: J domain-containing protein, partial [Chitinophagales bacterium]|nr:J domain-containing protein [Chitinophagales bacterium]
TSEQNQYSSVSDFDKCLIIIFSYVARADNTLGLKHLEWIRKKFLEIGGQINLEEKMQLFHYCYRNVVAIDSACSYIRNYTTKETPVQVLRWAYDLSVCESPLTESKRAALFHLSGMLNINDITFYQLLKEWSKNSFASLLALFELDEKASKNMLTSAYRKKILKIHPDRNPQYSESERRQAERELQRLREAYETLMKDHFKT